MTGAYCYNGPGTSPEHSTPYHRTSVFLFRLLFSSTRLQGGIAIASFSSGVTIAAVCLFFIPPLGEIASSAVSIVSELLVLCGAILGVKASYDVKFRKFEAELRDISEHETQPTT